MQHPPTRPQSRTMRRQQSSYGFLPMAKLESFSGIERFLSNSYRSKVTYKGIDFPTVEHGFHGAKVHPDKEKMKQIAEADSAEEIGAILESVEESPHWKEKSIKVMEKLLRQKFNIITLRQKLVKNTLGYIEYKSKDPFWGIGEEGNGLNNMGKLLMIVKKDIRGIGSYADNHQEILEEFGSQVAQELDSRIYVVGSALWDSSPRDVDIRAIMFKNRFKKKIGKIDAWIQEGKTGDWTDIRNRWSDLCMKYVDVARELGIENPDFQINPAGYITSVKRKIS